MRRRKPGLQKKWAYVVNSLQEIVPSYELASSRISLYADGRMRAETVAFALEAGSRVLDLGAGPGTMSKLISAMGGDPVLVDVSRQMLEASGFPNRVQAVFENLPFRDGVFDAAVSGFALRDAHDLGIAVARVAESVKDGGRFAFCDLGKPDSVLAQVAVACYLRVVPNVIGLAMVGRSGLRYGSIFDTYVLTLRNSQLRSGLLRRFRDVVIHETQFGGSIVAKCRR
jgi:demethylmenaquinone methyltransferase / 2-methoxy-6-polyprenyl-1,4-benzoquinol methylase